MKIYCKECSIYMGDLVKGSKLRPGIVFLCKNCHEKFKKKDTPRINTSSMPDFMKDFFQK